MWNWDWCGFAGTLSNSPRWLGTGELLPDLQRESQPLKVLGLHPDEERCVRKDRIGARASRRRDPANRPLTEKGSRRDE